MDDRDKEREREELKKKSVLIVGSMKSGNPFQLSLGVGSTTKETAERVKKSLEKGHVEIIDGDSGAVIIRWAEMESAVVMTEFELERRAILQAVQQRGR